MAALPNQEMVITLQPIKTYKRINLKTKMLF